MLSPHVPDLGALQLLSVIARTGSLSTAATEIGTTQQAASSRVSTMEALVGEPLLVRTRRGCSLTPAGELTLEWAQKVLEAAHELDAGITALRADRRGHLVVAASLTIAEHLLPGWMVALRAEQARRGTPPTEFKMTATNSENVASLIASGKADLGFVEGPDAPKGLRHRLVGADTLVVVVAPDHPWAQPRCRRVDAATLAATPLVVREVGSGTRHVLQRALQHHEQFHPHSSSPAPRRSGQQWPLVRAQPHSARTPCGRTWPSGDSSPSPCQGST